MVHPNDVKKTIEVMVRMIGNNCQAVIIGEGTSSGNHIAINVKNVELS